MNNNNFLTDMKTILDKSNNEKINNLYNDMSKHQKNIFNSWSDNIDSFINYSLSDLLFDFDADFIESILEIEIELYLKELRDNNIYNKRNGYTKDIALTFKDKNITINRPRLRNEKEFDSIFIPKRTRIIKDLNDNILLLYSKNNSVNDIKDILKNMFNITVSNGYISEVLQDISQKVYEWRNKPLKKCYFALNFDCTYIPIRDDKNINAHDIPVYVAIGTNLNGHKEILSVYLGNEDENKNIIDELHNKDIAEATSFWTNVFEDLKERGIEKILYCVSDGLTGIDNAVNSAFQNIFYQRCVVHLDRNLKTYTNKNNGKEIIGDFKKIYNSPTKEIALENWDYFQNKYKDNKTMLKHATEYMQHILPLFNVPVNIRKYIYTNNISESANSKIKRGFYGRGALPNVNSALNIIFLNLEDLEKKWAKAKVNNWDNIYNELITVHKKDIEQYL